MEINYVHLHANVNLLIHKPIILNVFILFNLELTLLNQYYPNRDDNNGVTKLQDCSAAQNLSSNILALLNPLGQI
jgi:hypothetical protein